MYKFFGGAPCDAPPPFLFSFSLLAARAASGYPRRRAIALRGHHSGRRNGPPARWRKSAPSAPSERASWRARVCVFCTFKSQSQNLFSPHAWRRSPPKDKKIMMRAKKTAESRKTYRTPSVLPHPIGTALSFFLTWNLLKHQLPQGKYALLPGHAVRYTACARKRIFVREMPLIIAHERVFV